MIYRTRFMENRLLRFLTACIFVALIFFIVGAIILYPSSEAVRWGIVIFGVSACVYGAYKLLEE